MKTLTALALLTGLFAATAAIAQPPAITGDEEAGREAYSMGCRGCHNGSIGPALRGVAGRKVAGVEGFLGYSESLKGKSGETWTDANLNAFLKAPTEFAPGSRMMKTTTDDQERADIIAYLKSLPAPK